MPPKYNPKKYQSFYPSSITRLVNILEDNGIKSRQDLLEKYDVDATAKQYQGLKHVGPVLAELLVWLRGKSINDWRRLTGIKVFNDPNLESNSKGQANIAALSEPPDTAA